MVFLPLLFLYFSLTKIECTYIHKVCDGNSLYIWCNKGQSLFILGAYYISNKGPYCSNPGTCLKVVSEMCNYEQSCTISIGNFTFKNNCPPGRNNLFVQYDCINNRPCKGSCGINEEWTPCKTACPIMCPNPAKPQPESCTEQCAGAGCQCKQNYFRDRQHGICLKKDYCPIPGDKHIAFSTCANDPKYYCIIKIKPPQNQNITTTTTTAIPDQDTGVCEPGYICKHPYIKDPLSNNCVLPEGCPIF